MPGKKWIGVCLVALCGVSGSALADWKGKGELGASIASGNSESESANAALEVKNTHDKWTHTLGLAGNYGSDGSTTNAERWEVRGQSDYTFTDRAYWFGRTLRGRPVQLLRFPGIARRVWLQDHQYRTDQVLGAGLPGYRLPSCARLGDPRTA